MRELSVLLCFVCFVDSFNAQEKRKLFKGKIVLDSIAISDVHTINKNTNIGTISTTDGFFKIPLKIGDSILFSHINLQKKLVIITEKIINNKNFKVHLLEKTHTLKEFTLEKPRSIFYQDKDIGSYAGPLVDAKTLNLPYANTRVKKDNSIIKIRSGGVVSIDNLINSLNGNNRRAKLLHKISNEDKELSKIRKAFTDDFFITDLKIKKEFINPFLNYCLDKKIIRIFKNNNRLKLTTLFIKESKSFPHKMLNEDLFLTKK